MHWELKDIRFLNDVISLFFLPHCGVCHPAKCFCNVTISVSVTITLFEKTFRHTSPSFK